jgi:lysophospholipase L1-like esterase
MKRFLALGDSYTIGEAVDPAERWPQQVVALLRARGAAIADPEIIARTGWTTDELAAGIAVAAPHGPYDLVSLLIGVNNQYRGRSAEEYQGEFRSLLASAIAFAGGRTAHVLVVSIPDWGVTPFAEGRDRRAIAADIDRFNSIGRAEAAREGAGFVDITPASRLPEADWLASDGLHPSGRQYLRWAELALDPVAAALAG